MTYCTECLNKQQQINELEDEVVSLKAKLRYQERTAKEGFFGSSTPSSKIPIKPNSQKNISIIRVAEKQVIKDMAGQVFARKRQIR
jgi:hypothetical protein